MSNAQEIIEQIRRGVYEANRCWQPHHPALANVLTPLTAKTLLDHIELCNRAKDAEIAALKVLLREVTAVAITMLYDGYPDDVAYEFSTSELEAISRASESLQPQKVEAIYRRGFDAAIAQAVQS